MDRLKIAELLDSYYPIIDGPIGVVTNYCRLLGERADCKLLVPKAAQKGYVDDKPFEVIRCASMKAPEGYRNALPGADGKFFRRVVSEHFDIFHTHSPFSLGMFAVRRAKKQGVPVVATLHTKYYEDFMRVLHGFKPGCDMMLSRIMRVYERADSVWTVNDASRQVLREYGYKGRIEVVRNGTDLSYPDNADELIERVNAAHGLHGQKNVFIFVGRIAFYKNLELMAKALAIVKARGVDFKMIMVGSGFDEAKFTKMVDEMGLSDNFIFAGSVRDRRLLQGYYLRSDLFLFPSTFDTSSLVPIEAAAHKLPVLLIEGSCTAENISDGVNGFLSPESPARYADKIVAIMSDENLRRKVGDEAARSVYRSWDTVADEVLARYKEVIARYNAEHK